MCILTCWRDSMDEPKSINGNGTAYFGWASSMTQLGGKFIHAASVFVAGRARAERYPNTSWSINRAFSIRSASTLSVADTQ